MPGQSMPRGSKRSRMPWRSGSGCSWLLKSPSVSLTTTGRRAWLTFVIVGGGPTGVELAGTLAEVSRQTLARDFRHVNTASARVILIEAGPRVLGAYTEELSESARLQLEKLGVAVWTGMQVTGIDDDGVSIGPDRIHARTVLWAAGVAGSPLARTLGVPLDGAGRVLVLPDLTIPGHEDVYVIGDLAHIELDGSPVPGVAPAAMQAGRHCAQNVIRTLRGEQRLPFRYRDKGMLATIGRGSAVARIGAIKASGFFAWLLWLFVHIFFLIGFRNRLIVMIHWAWSYVTFDRGARLITEPLKGPLLQPSSSGVESRGGSPSGRRQLIWIEHRSTSRLGVQGIRV